MIFNVWIHFLNKKMESVKVCVCGCGCVNDGVTSWKWAGCVGDDVIGAGNMAAAAHRIIRGETALAERGRRSRDPNVAAAAYR